MTLFGSAYFFSTMVFIKIQRGPLKGMEQSLKRQAAECITGTDIFPSRDEIICASLIVVYGSVSKGKMIPLNQAAGL